MAQRSSIEWTDATWNPIRGCSRISPGCQHCYAERMAARFSQPGMPFHELAVMARSGPHWTGRVELVEAQLEQPLRWRTPRTVFVNSMSDLFHEKLPEGAIQRVFDVMRRAPRHRFQVLTKRSQRLRELDAQIAWPPNVWMGVSVESADFLPRVADLRSTDAAIKFLSLEPLLAPLGQIDLRGIDWVIVGGESGPAARPMEPDWVCSIRDQCVRLGVPFFFKQWGGVNKKRTGRLLDGRTWDELPLGTLRPRDAQNAMALRTRWVDGRTCFC